MGEERNVCDESLGGKVKACMMRVRVLGGRRHVVRWYCVAGFSLGGGRNWGSVVGKGQGCWGSCCEGDRQRDGSLDVREGKRV